MIESMTKQKLRATLALSLKLALEKKMDIENMSRELPNLSGVVVREECPAQRISTWRERIGQPAEFPLHLATDVERAMEAEIAELRASQPTPHQNTLEAGRAVPTLGEIFASVGGWMNGGELGYPSFGSMEALMIFTQRSIRAALAADALLQIQSEAARDVLAERGRQVEAEGYDHGNDDEYVNDEMAAAAAFYVMPPGVRDWPMNGSSYGATIGQAIYPDWMPPKTGTRRRDLVKGAALALAEIERIDRAADKQPVAPSGALADNDGGVA